jgi:hypothetical protein
VELVGYAPVLDHLAVLETDDVHNVDLDRLPGGREAEDRASVHASGAVERPDGIAVGCELDDGELEVREPVVKGRDRCLRALDAWLVPSLVLEPAGETSSSTTLKSPCVKPTSMSLRNAAMLSSVDMLFSCGK